MESAEPQAQGGNAITGKSSQRPRVPRTEEQKRAARAKLEATRQKERDALELRLAGYTFEQIATDLGYSNGGAAWKAVDRLLQKQIEEPADRLISLEVGRLDAMLQAIYSKITAGDLGAIDRGLRIMERRAKLLGLDRPMRFDVRSMVEAMGKQHNFDADDIAAVLSDVETYMAATATADS